METSFPKALVDVVRPQQLSEQQATDFAIELANNKLEQAVEQDLCNYVKLIANSGLREVKTKTTWSLQAQEPMGPVTIAQSLYQLLAKLSERMKESLTQSTNHFALVVPFSHVPYLKAKNSVGESAFAMFKAVLPQVELVAVPQLHDSTNVSCALLVCKSQAYGPAGYLALHDNIYFRHVGDDHYRLSLPKHHLVLANQEQMAVLTGI